MRRSVRVNFTVDVDLDETKFTPEFMRDFSETIFRADLDDHFGHIAQLHIRGLLRDFTEGYGEIKDMGIKAETVIQEEEVWP